MDTIKLNDGINTISANQFHLDSAELSPYLGGDYRKALLNLYNTGRVFFNNIAAGGECPSVNGGELIHKNEDGSYNWISHIAVKGQTAVWEEAVISLLNGFSTLRSTYYDVSVSGGQIDGLYYTVHDFCFAKTVEIGDTATKITLCGDEIGSDARTDPTLIEFPNANVLPDSAGNMPSDQCGVLYWIGPEGWCLRRADCVRVTADPNTDPKGGFINRGCSMPWHRPTQPISAIGWGGEESADLYLWMYDAEIVAGVSRVEAQKPLKEAVSRAEDALDRIVPSSDGHDVPDGALWAPQERIDLFRGLVDSVKKTACTDNLYNSDYEEALYRLACAYGGVARYSRMCNIFKDGVGITKYAEHYKA